MRRHRRRTVALLTVVLSLLVYCLTACIAPPTIKFCINADRGAANSWTVWSNAQRDPVELRVVVATPKALVGSTVRLGSAQFKIEHGRGNWRYGDVRGEWPIGTYSLVVQDHDTGGRLYVMPFDTPHSKRSRLSC